jgi:hypothetical protein
MRRLRLIFLCVVLVAGGALSLLLFRVFSLTNSAELGSKPEWSVLQAADAGAEPTPHRVILKRDGSYCAVGVRIDATKTRSWLLLNPKYEPLVKVLPPGQEIRLTKAEIDDLRVKCSPHQTVIAYLQEHRLPD